MLMESFFLYLDSHFALSFSCGASKSISGERWVATRPTHAAVPSCFPEGPERPARGRSFPSCASASRSDSNTSDASPIPRKAADPNQARQGAQLQRTDAHGPSCRCVKRDDGRGRAVDEKGHRRHVVGGARKDNRGRRRPTRLPAIGLKRPGSESSALALGQR